MPFPFNFKFPHTAYHARQENSEYPYSDYHIIDLDFIINQIKQLWTYVTEHIVEFPLTIAKGGTGANNASTARTNLGLGALATLNRVPITYGGTNATSVAGARDNLGLGAVATEDTVPISKGGTGGTTAAEARQNLGIEETTVTFPITLEKGGTGINAQNLASLYNHLAVAGLDTPTAIPASSNLNDYKTPGVYIYERSNNTANKPYSSDSGTLFVVKSYIQSDTYIYQVALSYTRIYIRRFIVQTSNWSSWRQLVEDTDVISITHGGTGASNAADAITNLGIINSVYPVGSIYMSVSSTSPATLFGGTWERIKDRFLLAAGDTYAAGATGGEAAHTLTETEMPHHRHTVPVWGSNNEATGFGITQTQSFQDRVGVMKDGASWSGWAGGSGAHNNMPPYLAVYVWQRTA